MFFFNNADDCACQIMNQKIETVSNIKFLGFRLDDKFKFNNHVKHLNKNLARCNYTLSKIKKTRKIYWVSFRLINKLPSSDHKDKTRKYKSDKQSSEKIYI